MHLDNLSVKSVHKITEDLLQVNDDVRTRKLAELCHRRTNGNPFFLLQFLSLLHEEELLKYNLGTMRWIWDTIMIERYTVATENVVDFLGAKMEGLPKAHAQVLQLAALLSVSFQERLLFLIWEEFVGTLRWI